jgi:hypothetical protein
MATLSDIPALRLGRLFGIPIFLDVTFLLAVLTIFFGVVRRQFPSLADYGIVVLLVTAGVFLSILTHELGHALAARRFGLYADEIRIGGFYGLAILAGSPARRIDSILILLAGPLANAINSILLLLTLGMPTLTDSLYLGTPLFASPTPQRCASLRASASSWVCGVCSELSAIRRSSWPDRCFCWRTTASGGANWRRRRTRPRRISGAAAFRAGQLLAKEQAG